MQNPSCGVLFHICEPVELKEEHDGMSFVYLTNFLSHVFADQYTYDAHRNQFGAAIRTACGFASTMRWQPNTRLPLALKSGISTMPTSFEPFLRCTSDTYPGLHASFVDAPEPRRIAGAIVPTTSEGVPSYTVRYVDYREDDCGEVVKC